MSVPSTSVVSPKASGSVLGPKACCCASARDLPRLHPVKPCLSLVKDGGIDDRVDDETSRLVILRELVGICCSTPQSSNQVPRICVLRQAYLSSQHSHIVSQSINP